MDWIWWILQLLPFQHLVRVIDCFLHEGIKVKNNFYKVIPMNMINVHIYIMMRVLETVYKTFLVFSLTLVRFYGFDPDGR